MVTDDEHKAAIKRYLMLAVVVSLLGGAAGFLLFLILYGSVTHGLYGAVIGWVMTDLFLLALLDQVVGPGKKSDEISRQRGERTGADHKQH